MTNNRILELLENKTFSIIELEDLGFKDNKIIKSDSRPQNALMGSITYHDKTEYENYTLCIENSDKATVKRNSFNKEVADLHNQLRDERLKLEGLKNKIFAYRFEFNDNQTADEIEKEVSTQEAKINDIMSKIKKHK